MHAEYGESSGREERTAAIAFTPLDDSAGLELFDPVERHRYTFGTERPVSPTPASTDPFRFPVTDAVAIDVERLDLNGTVGVYVRDEDGEVVAEAEYLSQVELPPGSYSVELTTPIKTYLRVDAAMSVTSDFESTAIAFDGETRVLVGARSRHDHPAATVTTTRDPRDLMAAISTFGSALKTTSPERSFPTLRGHPPTVELGDELDVPAGLESPDTGVRIEVPESYREILVVAPLAYYLGAEVVPGDEPRIVTDTDFAYDLDAPDGFENEVERVLKQTFFLDCVTRTEGYYKVQLHEREAIESDVDLDFADLYDRPLAERLEAHLSVPFDLLREHLPEWKLTTHVRPDAESVELLPFLVDDLAVVRSPKARESTGSAAQLAAVNDFLRDDDFTRSASESATSGPATLKPEETDSLEQAWFGEGAPVGASKPTVEAFRNRLDRSLADGDVSITVVCNDVEMDEERSAVDAVYGSRDELPFDVQFHRELTCAELRDVLAEETEFLHYIGHIDERGFRCTDGRLDAHSLDSVGVDAFFLNACQSYRQGLALIERGAIGGVVTLRDVINSGAVTIGKTLARLLNSGFPLRVALNVASDETVIGSQYIVVGDGGHAIAQAQGGTPGLLRVESVGDEFEVSLSTFPTAQLGLGSFVTPQFGQGEKSYLNSGAIETLTMSRNDLVRSLAQIDMPVKLGDELTWTAELDFGSL